MKDVKQFISPYHHEKQPLELVNKYCTNAGFIIKHMEIREKIFVYRNEEQLKGTKILITFKVISRILRNLT